MLKATNISRYEAEDIKSLDDNTVLISINEEYEPLYSLQLDRNSSKILTVRFTDITANREWMGNTVHPISEETSLKMLDFINVNKDKNFIIHCAAGVSRSSAVCLYLNIIHGHKLKDDFWKVSRPNKFVLGSLMLYRFKK